LKPGAFKLWVSTGFSLDSPAVGERGGNGPGQAVARDVAVRRAFEAANILETRFSLHRFNGSNQAGRLQATGAVSSYRGGFKLPGRFQATGAVSSYRGSFKLPGRFQAVGQLTSTGTAPRLEREHSQARHVAQLGRQRPRDVAVQAAFSKANFETSFLAS
jgi:hypothetical protein